MLKRITVLTIVVLAVLCFLKYQLNSRVEAQASQISHVRIAGCTAPGTTNNAPQWSLQNRPCVITSKPAMAGPEL